MRKAYRFIYQSPPNPEKPAAYGKPAISAFRRFGSAPARTGNVAAAYERGVEERILIVEFPSLGKAIPPHDSPSYQESRKAPGDSAVRDVPIVEGGG